MATQRTEKGEAPVIGPTEASVKTTTAIKQEELSMSNSTQVAASRAITVPFHGANLFVIDHEGEPVTPMRPVVDGMGLDWKSQHAKLHSGRFKTCVVEITTQLPGDTQTRAVTCLPLRKFPGWLMGIHVGKIKPSARERVEFYQSECDDVLWQYWNDGIAINPRTAYSVLPDQTISDKQAETLRLLLSENVKKLPKEKQGGAMVKGWSKLKAHFKTDYRHIPAVEFHEAVNILARHVAEWELVDEAPKERTVPQIVADWVVKIESPNGYPAFLFQPLVDAVLRKSGRRMVELPPGKIVVDARKLAAVWVDLGKLRKRIDGLGVLESDLPPSWWESNAISAA